MEKHRNCPPHIDYTKCAKRCHLEIFSKSTDPLGRKTIYPAVHGGRPARKTHPHRTQSTARRTCCQKISNIWMKIRKTWSRSERSVWSKQSSHSSTIRELFWPLMHRNVSKMRSWCTYVPKRNPIKKSPSTNRSVPTVKWDQTLRHHRDRWRRRFRKNISPGKYSEIIWKSGEWTFRQRASCSENALRTLQRRRIHTTGDCQTTRHLALMYRVLKKVQLKNSGKYSDDFLMFCSGTVFLRRPQR